MQKMLLILLSLLVSSPGYAIEEGDLLPPEQAFSANARALDANTIEVEWKAAEGYYLYGDKFNFKSETPGLSIGDAIIPPGKKKFDPIFNKVLEIHRHKVVIQLPVTARPDGQNNLRLIVGAQGCADLGVCYPPQKQTILLNLPATATTNKRPPSGLQSLTTLGNSLGLGGEQEFLPPDKAFAFSARMDDNGNIIADWQIAPDYYLYRDKFSFSTDTAGVQLGAANMPAGQMHFGILPNGSEGDVEVYIHGVQISIPVSRSDDSVSAVNFIAKFQGCADAGICYPPITKQVSLPLLQSITTDTATMTAEPAMAEAGKSYLSYIIIAFGVGLLLTFTPCVLPMIPILSSIIVGQSVDGKISKLKGGLLSLSYVLGTAVIYTAAGWVAGKSGDQLQASFQNPWLLGGVSIILVLLSLSMFGLFTIQMPAFIQSRMQTHSSDIKGGSLFGVFIMGILSSMIVGACASPILLSVLLVAIESQDPLLGALIMFSMSLGMGVILIAIGIGAGFLIPKAGTWMDSVKYFFGILLIGVAIYILTALPAVPVLLLWGVFFITIGVYLGATQGLPEGASGWRMFWKGIGTVLLIWGVLSLLGGLQGNRDPLQPIDFNSLTARAPAGGQAERAHAQFTQIRSITDLDREMAAARSAGKPVLIDFFATWCTDCVRMEKATFNKPEVQQLMQNFVALQVDVTDPANPGTSAVQKKLGVYGPPALLFFNKDGTANKKYNFYGYKSAEGFAAHLQAAMQ